MSELVGDYCGHMVFVARSDGSGSDIAPESLMDATVFIYAPTRTGREGREFMGRLAVALPLAVCFAGDEWGGINAFERVAFTSDESPHIMTYLISDSSFQDSLNDFLWICLPDLDRFVEWKWRSIIVVGSDAEYHHAVSEIVKRLQMPPGD